MARTDVEGTKKGKTLTLDELGRSSGIDLEAESVTEKDIELEEFMNQKVLILVHQDNSRDALPVITPSVNGINQPIIRGQKQWVRRKYVEALARGTYTRYLQETPDPRKPENIQMTEQTSISYPFSVYEDPSPRGKEWLESVLGRMR